MRKALLIFSLGWGLSLTVQGEDRSNLYYGLELSLAGAEIDNLSLGDDPDVDRLEEEEYELAFTIEYQASDQLYFYFGGSLIDEAEEIKPNGEDESLSGFERGEIGFGYSFGSEITSEIRVGRREFISASDWWYWWDEDLDSVSLDSRWGKFEALIAIAEEQAREVTDMDFIDPEQEDVRRILLGFDWEFADNQLLQFYYLDQDDRSSAYRDGQSLRVDKIDEGDANLTWKGINYLGWFELESFGEVELELAYAEVSGRETVYEFDDPAGGRADVDETVRQRIDGEARGIRLSLTPAAFDDVTFIIGHARGSGDRTEDDGKDDSFRQTGLQGDSEVFGELFQPELSNLVVDTIGIEFGYFDNFDIALFHHDYRQDELADEMRDVSIEFDTEGNSRDLGREIDLVLTFNVYAIEVELIAAEFEAGRAYSDKRGETSRYWQVELTYVF